MAITLTSGNYEPEPDDAEIAEMVDAAEIYSNTVDDREMIAPAPQESIYYGCNRRLGATAINQDTLNRAKSCIPIGYILLSRH